MEIHEEYEITSRSPAEAGPPNILVDVLLGHGVLNNLPVAEGDVAA